MATHSCLLAQRIPKDREPGGLQSPGSQREGHYWVTKHSTENPVFLAGKSHEQRSLTGYSPWIAKQRDITQLLIKATVLLSISTILYNRYLQFVSCMKSENRSVVSGSLQPMDCTEFSRPEYWNGQLFPSPGDLPNPGI